MPEILYEIADLSHHYGGKPALTVPSLTIPRATIVGLAGPNGSGKSTLLKLLGFVTRPSRGTIRFKGRAAQPFSDTVRFQVTLLPQEPYLMKRTVFQNMAYGLRLRGNGGDSEELIKDALGKVGLNHREFIHRQWHALSGGEAQRVALAARLVLKPEVLLLDEPIASVDADSSQRIKEAALGAREQWGTTLVVASHDREWLEDICDNVLFLFRGRILGAENENSIFGPWHRTSSHGFEKILRDGQRLQVSAPPDAAAIAMIDPGDLRLCESARDMSDQDRVCSVRGVITRISLEKKTGMIRITVSAGGLSLSVRQNRDSLKGGAFMPGRETVVAYRPEDLRWINNAP